MTSHYRLHIFRSEALARTSTRRRPVGSLVRALACLVLTGMGVCSPALAAIAFVQVNSSDPETPESTVSVAFPGAQTTGNLNIVAIGWSDSTNQVESVTDTAGNTYV